MSNDQQPRLHVNTNAGSMREDLERMITRKMHDAWLEQQAPEEVIHRRINGREVLNRRVQKGAAWRTRKP